MMTGNETGNMSTGVKVVTGGISEDGITKMKRNELRHTGVDFDYGGMVFDSGDGRKDTHQQVLG